MTANCGISSGRIWMRTVTQSEGLCSLPSSTWNHLSFQTSTPLCWIMFSAVHSYFFEVKEIEAFPPPYYFLMVFFFLDIHAFLAGCLTQSSYLVFGGTTERRKKKTPHGLLKKGVWSITLRQSHSAQKVFLITQFNTTLLVHDPSL